MLTQFSQHIDTHFPFLKGKKILVAISGGIDSVVLTHLLHQLKIPVVLAHCNFRLRGKEADNDEQFIKNLGQQLSLSVYTKSFNTEAYATENKLSVQMAARKLRYDWFYEIIAEHQLDYIATAHHLDDNLETFLINFTRGTGLSGLTGIPEINGVIIRPLLPFSRGEITAFATNNAIAWREDKSNAETKYKRNKIRHQIVPLLKELNPNLLSSFKNTTEHLKGSQHIIDNSISQISETIISSNPVENLIKFNIQELKKIDNPKAYLFELLKKYNFTEWNDVSNLLNSQSGKQLFSETHRLVKDRDFLLLTELHPVKEKEYKITEKDTVLKTENFKLLLTHKTNNVQNSVHGNKNLIIIDKDKLKFPLVVRKWKEGDYFYPFGMNGKKKLSKFFKDEKLSLIAKENTWLLCSENEIVWVLEKRLDNRFKITSNTKSIVHIDLIKI